MGKFDALLSIVSIQLVMYRTCKDWNDGGCSRPGKDRNHCGYGDLSLRHGCSKIIGGNRICWDKFHTEKEHK